MTYSTAQLCSGGGGYEAIPRPRLALDLVQMKERLETAGIAVVDARVMLLVQMEREVTLSRDGRILIKTRDPVEADRILAKLCERLELPRDAPTPA